MFCNLKPKAAASLFLWGLILAACGDGPVVGAPCLEPLSPCPDGCYNLAGDVNHCGGCNIQCEDEEVCQNGVCLILCDDVDMMTDPFHCGECGNVCASGICSEGVCDDIPAGHLVAIGHDYQQSHPSQDRLIANAVFMVPTNPVEVLAYNEFANSGHVTNTDQAITSAAENIGRSWNSVTATSKDEVVTDLLSYQVLLVYHQALARDDALEEVGKTLAPVLSSFFEQGGIVIFLDGVGDNRGTWQIFNAAGLFTCDGLTDVTGSTATVRDRGNAVAQGVTLKYLATTNSVAFMTEESDIVIQDSSSGFPMAIHKTPQQ